MPHEDEATPLLRKIYRRQRWGGGWLVVLGFLAIVAALVFLPRIFGALP